MANRGFPASRLRVLSRIAQARARGSAARPDSANCACQRPLAAGIIRRVHRRGDGHCQQPLGDAGAEAFGGGAALAFEVGLALEGVVDRFDLLADPSRRTYDEAPRPGGRARIRCRPNPAVTKSSKSREAKPLPPIRTSPGRSAPVRAACASSSAVTSRSPIFGLARHQGMGIPSGVVIRHSFGPRRAGRLPTRGRLRSRAADAQTSLAQHRKCAVTRFGAALMGARANETAAHSGSARILPLTVHYVR
jgi:hypothetical protein